MNLESIGADAHVRGAFEPYRRRGLALARIAAAQRDLYRLYTETGEVSGEPSGSLWFSATDAAGMPATGDWVAVRIVSAGQAIVEAVLSRRSCFYRRAAGKREDRQAIAANVDLVLIVCGLDGDYNPRRIERYLTLAGEAGLAAVIVLNKADQRSGAGGCVRECEALSHAPAVAITAIEADGIAPLRTYLQPAMTIALLGSSGAGKSTIANALLGEERLRTGAVREADSRGRHTTTHRELIPLPGGGALIDTPGMRELQLWAGPASVDVVFDDVAALAAQCRFSNCSHTREPGCAVAGALAAGALAADRWQSYRKLRAEAHRHEALADARLAHEDKRKLKRLMRDVKRMYKARE